MAYTGYKIYRNRRRTVLINGVTESSLTLTEPNLNGVGLGPYFPPVLDLLSCPISNCDPILGSVVYSEPTTTTSTTTTTTTVPIQLMRIYLDNIYGLTLSVGLTNAMDDVYVDWGDGDISPTFNTSTILAHTYSSPITGSASINSVDLSSILYINNDVIDGTSAYISGDDFINLVGLESLSLSAIGISSSTSQLPSTLKTLYTLRNDISGDVANLPTGITGICLIYGNNTISGDVSNLPSGISEFLIIGSNTLSGNLSGIPQSISNIYILGNNTISGSISGLSNSVTSLIILGNNTISGDVSTLPSNLSVLNISGNNTISGDVSGISMSTITRLTVLGSNTISGDISNISSLPLIEFGVYGNNTLSGNVASIPSSITNFQVSGSNTIFGSLSDIPSGVQTFIIGGLSTVNDYVSGRTWSSTMRQISVNGLTSSGFSASEIDNILIDLYNTSPTWVGNSKSILLKGVDVPKRTSSSDAAVFGLTSIGVSISLV